MGYPEGCSKSENTIGKTLETTNNIPQKSGKTTVTGTCGGTRDAHNESTKREKEKRKDDTENHTKRRRRKQKKRRIARKHKEPKKVNDKEGEWKNKDERAAIEKDKIDNNHYRGQTVCPDLVKRSIT